MVRVKRKPMMVDEDKLERVIQHLTTSHLETFGGYPYDHDWIGSTLVVAALDESHATKLGKYDRKALLGWYDQAVEFAEQEDEDMATAFWETAPEQLR
jgi:hypothetical protein